VRRPTALLAALALALAAGCGADEESASTTAGAPATDAQTPPPAETNAAGCRVAEIPAPKEVPARRRPPSLRVRRGEPLQAVVRTSCGAFTIALDTRRAPRTVASFVALSREDFFDGTAFHRVVPEFVIQGGDPAGNGTGGPGYTVVEAPPRRVRYPRYAVAMAKTAVDPPGASGSQFYVVTSDQGGAQLEPIYALLGRVSAGRAVVDRIGAVAADPQTQAPLEPVVIDDVAVEEG
jgi:cyclophilin family peptidyl-prolyl cis-trans isomerase